ncbi:MAG: hypothetical protein ACI4XI_00075 [Ruminococcus sp.]
MECFRKIMNRLLFPHIAVVIISVPVAAALLIYAFMFCDKESPIAYVSYVFSAYTMTIVCIRAFKIIRSKGKNVKAVIHKNKYAHRYLTDVHFKMHISLYLSLGINLLYAVLKLFSGVYFQSVWFGTLGVYYLLLAAMRFLLLRHANKNPFGKELDSELKRYRLCGVILMLMNIALTGVVILVTRQNQGFEYAGYLIYIMAMYAFYTIITAVINVVKYLKYESPVMSAAKAVNLAAALVSMLALETAMLSQFGKSENSPLFRQIMTGATGGCVCLIILGIAVYMIVKSTRQLRKRNSDD